MSWNFRSLDSLLEKSGSDRAGNHDFPVLSITMRDGLVDQSEKFKKRIASKDTTKYRIAYRNELVVGFPIDEGVLGFQKKYHAGIVSPAYNIWKLKESDAVCIPYLERYLRSTQARRIYASKMQGAVARRRSLTKADFLALEIPFPALNDQKQIAHLLGKVEGLIAQRKQHLQQLDDLLKSVFLEMFGDPVRNEKGWERKTFGDLLVGIDSGKSPKCEAREAQDNEWGVLKLGAVTSCLYKDRENKALPQGTEPNTQHEVKAGDLLFSRKNTYELVAACVYVFETKPKLLLPDLIFRFMLKRESGINPIFLWKLLISDTQRMKIQSLAGGAAGSMPNISKTNLKKVLLPIPPTALQNQFATIVKKVESLKSRYQQSLTDLETLYGALSQKAFKGELDLSRVPLPTEDNDMMQEDITEAEDTQPMEPSFELPAPADLSALHSPEGRKSLIDQWLTAWLEHLGGAPFAVQPFMETARQQLGELTEDGTSDWGAAEYGEIKVIVFEALKQGRLIQDYDEAEKQVRITAAKE